MRVHNGIESYSRENEPVVASIGNYDGVHLGHQAILARVLEDAGRTGHDSLLISFDPHPLSVVAPLRSPKLIQTRRQKLDHLERSGLAGLLLIRFDAKVAGLSGEAFFADLLLSHIRIDALHVGWNFRFGNARSGDAELLKRIGTEHGFRVEIVPAVQVGDQTVSSSAIRQLVAEGQVAQARKLLGRPYAVEGEVVAGDGRGRKIAFPTANLLTENQLLPERGVYVTRTRHCSASYPSVTNVGIRPTFGGKALVIETHLLDFDEQIYGDRVEIDLLDRIRDEMRFDGPSELADQIARDRAAADAYFQNIEFRPDPVR